MTPNQIATLMHLAMERTRALTAFHNGQIKRSECLDACGRFDGAASDVLPALLAAAETLEKVQALTQDLLASRQNIHQDCCDPPHGCCNDCRRLTTLLALLAPAPARQETT